MPSMRTLNIAAPSTWPARNGVIWPAQQRRGMQPLR